MESTRYVDLLEQPTITKIELQVEFQFTVFKAKYNYGCIMPKRPKLVGHTKEKKSRAKYTADFVYYDSTTPLGWVIEEFKPTENLQKPYIQSMRDRLNRLYDEHSDFGHICYSVPARHVETVFGKNLIKSYKRVFVTRCEINDGIVQYKDYNQMFNNEKKRRKK